MGDSQWVGRLLTVAVLGLGLMGAATGAGVADEPISTSMVTGGLTSQPIGHYDFCKRLPVECAIRPRDRGPMPLSGDSWAKIERVNLAVNRAVRPKSDWDIYGVEEYWTYPDQGVGDCEDYALEKRRQLMRKGVPLSDILITVVRKPDGEGHAVLTLRTDRGDFILDNLNDEIRPWSQTGYKFLKRQATNHTGRWVTLREGPSALVAAVN
jgi:predicted transglutaminase-like cysteine proteinase